MEPDVPVKLVIRPKGRGVTALEGVLDASTVTLLEPVLARIANEESGPVALECHKLEFISSSGIGALMSLHGLLEPKGRTIELLNVAPEVYRAFEILGLAQLFRLAKPSGP